MQADAPLPDEHAVPAPLDDVSDVDSHNVSEIAENDDHGEEVQQGSNDDGEDLMENISGYAPSSRADLILYSINGFLSESVADIQSLQERLACDLQTVSLPCWTGNKGQAH